MKRILELLLALTVFVQFAISDSLYINPRVTFAGNYQKFRVQLTFDRPVNQGDRILLTFPRMWQKPQLVNPDTSGYCLVLYGGTALIESSVTSSNVVGYPGSSDALLIRFISGTIQASDSIVFELGRDPLTNRGIRISCFAGMEYFTAEITRDGMTSRVKAQLELLPSPGFNFRIVAPSVVGIGEPFKVKLTIVDVWGNNDWNYSGSLTFDETQPQITLNPFMLTFQPTDSGLQSLSSQINSMGVYALRAIDKESKTRLSNPILAVADSQFRIYWGDMHCHSVMSNHGYGLPDQLFRYARDVSRLNFVVYTEHDWIGDSLFSTLVQSSREFDGDTSFLSFVGTEYTGPGAHVNLLLPQDNPVLLSVARYPTVLSLVDGLRQIGGFGTINHPFRLEHTNFTQWHEVDDRVIRNIEIVNSSTIYEFPGVGGNESVFEKLQKGLVLGFVGGSDNHHSHPASIPNSHRYSGITAVLAKSLTKADVFEALWSRRTYVTTGSRPVIQFTVNDSSIGSTFISKNDLATVRIKGSIWNNVRIDSIRIMHRDGKLLEYVPASGFFQFDTTFVVDVSNTFDFFYLAMQDSVMDRAWTSPVWIVTEKLIPPPRGESNFGVSEVFPSPTSGTINFTINPTSAPLTVKLFDILGREVHDFEIASRSLPTLYELDFRSKSLATGVYYLKVVSQSSFVIKKFLFLR